MEQQMDAFTLKRFELMVEIATKKLQQEIEALKAALSSVHSELSSLKSQVNRAQFQPPQKSVQTTFGEIHEQKVEQQPGKKEAKIVDCRPDDEKKQEFVSGAAKNTEPVRPRYGEYKPEDVAVDKFFYFGNKRQ